MQNYSDNVSSDKRRQTKIIWGSLFLLVFIIGLGVFAEQAFHSKSSRPPQADQNHDTTFNGMSAFIDNGLTTDQSNNLTKAFSKFAPKARSVSVDANSLSPGPHNPRSADPSFSINFNVSIDGVSYSGTVKYSGLYLVRLFLFNQAQQQVFDSGNIG